MEAKGSRGISVFIVPAGTPGLEVGKPEQKMSNRSSYSCPLTFTDVRIPKENLLGELNRGFPLFMKCVDDGRVAISAVAVGMAQGVLERAAKYSKERVTFAKVTLSLEYLAARSKTPCAIPTATAEIATRPSSTHFINSGKPLFNSPNRFSFGIRTSVKVSGHE